MPALPRILLISRQPPVPTGCGARMRAWQHLKICSAVGEVAVFSVHSDGKCVGQTDDVPVQHWYEQTVPCTVANAARASTGLLQRQSPVCNLFYRPSFARALEQLLETFQPDIALFSEPWLNRYLPIVQRSGCRIIFDMHNVEKALYTSLRRGSVSLSHSLRSVVLGVTASIIERQFLQVADSVWVCSEADRALCRKHYRPAVEPVVVPNSVDTQRYASVPPVSPGEPFTILFCGGYWYAPNAEAARLLTDHVFPAVQKHVPGARLLLVGSRPTKRMRRRARENAAITVTGYVKDVRPYLARASVVTVPLLRGGGTSFKVLEAMAARRPLVCTSTAIRGLRMRDGVDIHVADTPAALAQACIACHASPAHCANVAEAAHTVVRQQYDLEKIQPQVERVLQQLWQQRDVRTPAHV